MDDVPREKPVLETPKPRRRRWLRGILVGLPLLALLAALDAFLLEPDWVVLTRHETGSGKNEITVLHLTDIHFTTSGSREERVLEILSETRPDLVVVTGDSVLHETDMAGLTEFLSKLDAPLGVFACPGNWEDWVKDAYDVYPAAGVTMLSDRAVRVGDPPVELLGLRNALSPVPPRGEVPRIVLCHYPAIFPKVAASRSELVLAGHTHGGQVRLPVVGPLHLPFDSAGYDAGWFERDGSRMYVSRGVGMSILPVRFLCRPEVALITFRY